MVRVMVRVMVRMMVRIMVRVTVRVMVRVMVRIMVRVMVRIMVRMMVRIMVRVHTRCHHMLLSPDLIVSVSTESLQEGLTKVQEHSRQARRELLGLGRVLFVPVSVSVVLIFHCDFICVLKCIFVLLR